MTATYLLDTHVLLWMLGEPERLSPGVRKALADPGRVLLVSAASAWEIATKHRLGKLPEADVLVRGFEGHLRRLRVQCLDVTCAHSLLAGSLEWSHRDPFDRMIAAQCMTEALSLVSAERAFTSLPGLAVVQPGTA